MLEQFLATFAGVILSFLLWFGGERIIGHQREEKAREHLSKEIIEEIKENIEILNLFANLIEMNLKAGNIPILGQKLNISARHYSVSSGELRLINSSEQRKLIRNSIYICEDFNHFVENTELLLAIGNLKAQPQALSLATYRLYQLKEHARETAKYLQNIAEELTNLQSDRNPSTEEGVMRERNYIMSYAGLIAALAGFLLISLGNWGKSIPDKTETVIIVITMVYFILCGISIGLKTSLEIDLLLGWQDGQFK